MSYNEPIRSDDPQAVEKLRAKLESCQQKQEQMKALNAYYRKHGTCKGYKELPDETAAKLDAQIAQAYSWDKQPYPSYALTNNNAEIGRLKKRIAQLEQDKATGFAGWKFKGGEVVADDDICRLQVFFDEKPDEATRNTLKLNGFKWAPSQGAWQRQLSSSAIYAAARVEAIRPENGENPVLLQPKAPKRDAPER